MSIFVYKKIVTIADTDTFGIVYYLNYLRWCAEAREVFAFQYLQGFPENYLICVINMDTKFLNPAKLKDEILISISLDFTKRKIPYDMYFDLSKCSDQTKVATHRQTLLFRNVNGKVIKLPEQAVQLIKEYRRAIVKNKE